VLLTVDLRLRLIDIYSALNFLYIISITLSVQCSLTIHSIAPTIYIHVWCLFLRHQLLLLQLWLLRLFRAIFVANRDALLTVIPRKAYLLHQHLLLLLLQIIIARGWLWLDMNLYYLDEFIEIVERVLVVKQSVCKFLKSFEETVEIHLAIITTFNYTLVYYIVMSFNY